MSRIDVELEADGWRSVDGVRPLVRRAAQLAAGARERRSIAILLTDDDRVRELNSTFRGKDAPTNVLAFPAPHGDAEHLGDVALALGVCREEAQAQGKSLPDHLRHLVIHGVLHLAGHDHVDDDEARAMESLERRLLADSASMIPTPPRRRHERDRARAAARAGRPLSRMFEGEREEDAEEDQAASALREQAVAFQTTTVGDVMTPRADIEAVEISTPFDEVVAAFADSEHSRLPVFRETLDDPVGFIHLRDVFKRLAAPGDSSGAVELARLTRETLYVPASMRAADLLVRMQASRVHLAMVIDEFGGVDGLVSLEDVLEAVVGEIDDEHDETAAPILSRAGGVFEVDGRVALEDLEEALGVTLTTDALDEEEIDTAAGLVTAMAGRVPVRGEVIVHEAGFAFEVTDADPRRVKRLRVRPSLESA